MNKILLRKMAISIFCLSISVIFYGCGREENIEGYWVSGDGAYSVSFNNDNTIVVDGKYIGKYEIYNERKMAINVDTEIFDEVLDITMSAEYEVTDGVLTITDVESGESFEYYTQEKEKEFINETYGVKYQDYTGIRDISSYALLGYFDDNDNLVKEFDWESDDTDMLIKESRSTAEKLFEEEVLPLYEKINPNGKYHAYSNYLIGANGAILHEIELRCEGADTISIVDRFAIETTENLIYLYDVADDTYKLWNGTVVVGKSLFDR